MGRAVRSDRQRVTGPEAAAPDVADLVRGGSAFAFDLYRNLSQKSGNLFYSPHSLWLALAMVYAGARGETEAQMAGALHFPLDQGHLHPTFNHLDLKITPRSVGAKGDEGRTGFRLRIANALWSQEAYTFLPEYLDVLGENYGAAVRLVDFADKTEQARAAINAWVSDQTEGKIKDLVARGAINALTRLVLTNAIYFYGAWANPFKAQRTHDGVFYLLDGGQARVPLMAQTGSFAYAVGEGFQVVELPYQGWALSMVILLPDAGKAGAVERTLDAERLDAALGMLSRRQVALTLPRFRFASGFGLAKVLADMGMALAFTTDADFSGMTGGRDLFISDVLHRAFVSVDEAGTEAAAATAVVMMPTMVMPEPAIEFRVDRPFGFLIRDIKTGAILFVGRVVDPRG